jgi:hypothetical protein
MTADEYAQEFECSFAASVKGAVYTQELLAARRDGIVIPRQRRRRSRVGMADRQQQHWIQLYLAGYRDGLAARTATPPAEVVAFAQTLGFKHRASA